MLLLRQLLGLLCCCMRHVFNMFQLWLSWLLHQPMLLFRGFARLVVTL
jgi:hypothetical protein